MRNEYRKSEYRDFLLQDQENRASNCLVIGATLVVVPVICSLFGIDGWLTFISIITGLMLLLIGIGIMPGTGRADD